MTQIAATQKNWPMRVGAEGIAAAQFARCGFDVLTQAGRDMAWYDLVVTRAGSLLKVSVKASEDGQWSLTEGYSRRAPDVSGTRFDCHAAIDRWVDSHGSRSVCCLVQFEAVAIHELPRVYLALPQEIAVRMRDTVERVGMCALFEKYLWSPAGGPQRTEALPASWLFSHSRVEELLQITSGSYVAPTKPTLVPRPVALTA